MTTQIVNGALEVTPTIEDWEKGVLLTATDTRTNNHTKGTPSLVADLFGDWREEMLVRTTDSSAIRIYTSTEVTNHKLYTLMHNSQYRTGIARQNTSYNQPSYPSFYFASEMDWAKVPLSDTRMSMNVNMLDTLVQKYKASGEIKGAIHTELSQLMKQMKRDLDKGSSKDVLKSMKKVISKLDKHKNKHNSHLSPEAQRHLAYYATLTMAVGEK
ncbi:Rhamnogalacturonan exolyase YesX [compost metagenome]